MLKPPLTVMPKIKIKTEKLFELYKELSSRTRNFKEISPEILVEHPEFIVIFRLLLDESLTSMGELIGKTYATVAQYENGKIKSVPLTESRRITKIIKEKLPRKLKFGIVKKNFDKFRQLSEGGSIQAFKRAETAELTEQEAKVRDALEQLNIKFEPNKTLKTSIGLLNFDFWLPEKNTVIECTISVYKEKAESLGFRILKLKDEINCRSIAILNPKISKGILRRLTDYDHILFTTNLSELKNILV